ncbi:uncharacterized protein Z519_04240 [Cladophialophora bantiana CBS 173.52]|uniref:FAD-binding domain-containing protein n=1 Tax=Cladophialophora bantiana (strain ATCC 10958 / CBS 173.52 / CDC B-1940 / NIH 8579) TaxID=1442370 RepID=A0A0D2HXJ1_CLAB1|nr:uncharacterized protein Z519_04240 [Cladophialophora bantiana CBS 173.52]KIW95655.1 hypothetical protein Z519_04240 [Cladophialophora bantiana CBS 173.52]
MSHKINKIAIVGAGPVGLLAAILISRLGVPVDLLDVGEGVDLRPRGAAYGPSAVRGLRRAGVLDQIRAKGIELCWRKVSGEWITGLKDCFDETYTDRFAILPVDKLSMLLYEDLKKYPTAKVFWEHNFTGLTQDAEQVIISTEHNGQTKTFTADFLVGCNGGQSGVRRALFGRRFPGHTWEHQIVATNVRVETAMMENYGWSDISWMIDPEYWFVEAKIEADPGVWRVSYGEPGHLDEKELRARCAGKLAKILPGDPQPGDYELERFSPFKLQQRCAEKMTVGRVTLAGDAAHIYNPMGGYGLTSGIADIGSLVDCFQGIHEGLATINILNKYDQKRREKYYTIAEAARNPVTAKAYFQAPDDLSVDMTQWI